MNLISLFRTNNTYDYINPSQITRIYSINKQVTAIGMSDGSEEHYKVPIKELLTILKNVTYSDKTHFMDRLADLMHKGINA